MTDNFFWLFFGGRGSKKSFFSGDVDPMFPRSSSNSSFVHFSNGLFDFSSDPETRSLILNLLPDEGS
jgi:hypothetical protein